MHESKIRQCAESPTIGQSPFRLLLRIPKVLNPRVGDHTTRINRITRINISSRNKKVQLLTAYSIFSMASLKRQIVMALVVWLLLVAALAALFRSWWVLELYLFPSIMFVWMLCNEDRLKKTKAGLKPLSPSVRVHFFFTVPLLVGVRL